MIKLAKRISSVPELPCVCGGSDYALLFEGTRDIPETGQFLDFRILKCQGCGLARTYPVPLEGNIRFEEPELASAYIEALTHDRDGRKKTWTLLACEVLDEINRFKRHGRLLDIGCSTGLLLDLARNEGWDCYGIDLSPGFCEYVKSIGIKVKNTDITNAGFPDRYFDVISMSHVLEHIIDLIETLTEIKRILKDDGVLVISAPNIGTLLAKLQRESYLVLQPHCHIWQFTPTTLKALLARVGFAPIRTSFHSHDSPLAAYKVILRNPGETLMRTRRRFHIPLRIYSFLDNHSNRVVSRIAVRSMEIAFRILSAARICGDCVFVTAAKG